MQISGYFMRINAEPCANEIDQETKISKWEKVSFCRTASRMVYMVLMIHLCDMFCGYVCAFDYYYELQN